MIGINEESEPIHKACKQLAGNIARLKREADVDEYSIWEDSGLRKAWGKLETAIAESVPDGTRWEGVWIQFAIDDAWRGSEESASVIARSLITKVENTLRLHMDAEWVALTPLGRQFSNFPDYTDLGDFAIVNASNGKPEDAADRFRSILEQKLGANFVESPEMDSSYGCELPKLTEESSGYFPLRPQLLLRLERGQTMANFRTFRTRIDRLLPLIMLSEMFAQIYLTEKGDDLYEPRSVIKPQPSVFLPNGSRMPDGLIRVPDFAALLNMNRGDLWNASFYFQRSPDWGMLALFESNSTRLLNVDRFKKAWEAVGGPLLVLMQLMEQRELNRTFRRAFESSIRMIAQCRHWQACPIPNPNLYAVIATETLLNPFKKGSINRRFAKFGAGLIEDDLSKRAKARERLKELYQQRCDFVHGSSPFWDAYPSSWGDEAVSKVAAPSLALFFECLCYIQKWAGDRILANESVSEAAFEEFYRRTIKDSAGQP